MYTKPDRRGYSGHVLWLLPGRSVDVAAYEFLNAEIETQLDIERIEYRVVRCGPIKQVLLNVCVNVAQAMQIGGADDSRSSRGCEPRRSVALEDCCVRYGSGYIDPAQRPRVLHPIYARVTKEPDWVWPSSTSSLRRTSGPCSD